MMTTYDFYKSKYYGDIVPDSSFAKYESLAEDDLHYITSDRLRNEKTFDDRVQKAVCALADLEYQLYIAKESTGVNGDGTGKQIKSKSSGGESISYDIGNNMIYAVLSDITAQKKLKYNTAKQYLSGTGLLYAGI